MGTDARGPAVELVVLLASAGGLQALSTVLRDLPTEFPAAVVVEQHLADHPSALPAILCRETAHPVSWAQDGKRLAPGQAVVCPPGKILQVTRDGRCRLRDAGGLVAGRFDRLLRSVARAYGPRSLAVVLSGSGRDGAAGTAAMKRAGAIVIAESPDTAQYGSMPMAAAQAGADLVLPVDEIGRVVNDTVAGVPLPLPLPKAPVTPRARVDGAHPVGLADLLQHLVANDPGSRAEVARLRADELRRRRQDLAAGLGATMQTAVAARHRAEESLRRAQLAHQAAEEAIARREALTARRTASSPLPSAAAPRPRFPRSTETTCT